VGGPGRKRGRLVRRAWQRLDTRFTAGIGLAVLLLVGWQLFNHYFFMNYLMGRLEMSMVYYHYLSFMVELLLVAVVALFASRVLVAKNRELEELQRQKDTLVDALVHDLRQPLTAVVGGLSSLTGSGELSEQTGELASIAQEGASELLHMVNDLLDATRLEAGRPLIEVREMPGDEFVRHGAHLLGALAAEKRVTLTVDLPPDLPRVWGDSERLHRVVMNLVGNAVKFTDPGGQVTVSARPEEERGALVVSVSDTGIGIPPGEQQHIFEKFSRAAGTPLSGRTSTGLGLYFCKLTVEAHGGKIWVESRVGEGATFRFTVPLAGRGQKA